MGYSLKKYEDVILRTNDKVDLINYNVNKLNEEV